MAENPVTRSALVSRVAELYGIDSAVDTDIATVALNLLDETVKEMNAHLYEFNKMTKVSVSLVAGTQTVDLSATTPVIYKESLAYLVETATSQRQDPLQYIVYEDFIKQFGKDYSTGTPSAYTFRNQALTTLLSFWPIPDATAATRFTLTLEYYRRIPLISSVAVGSSIDVPAEVETALMYGAMKRMAIHMKGASHPDVMSFDALESKALEKLRNMERLHPDAPRRFRLFGQHSSTMMTKEANVVYIRVR